MKQVFFRTDEERFRKNIFEEKCYELDDMGNDLVVVDVGAHVGIYTEYILPRAKTVYAIEPASINFKRLEEKYKDNPKVVLINKAMSGDGKSYMLYSQGTDGGISMMYNTGEELEVVPSLTFGDLINQHNISHIDILKVDCEGSEREIFNSPSFKNNIAKVDRIIGEVHLLQSDRLKYTINVSWYLNNLGFSYEEKNGVFKCKRGK